MKHIDVRIGCSDQFQVFVHDVLLAVEKEYPVTAQITVTELPPPQVGEDEGSSCCGRCWKNDGHCPHYKIGLHHCLYFIPAVSSPPPRREIEERICLTCRRKTCDRQPEDVDLANCPDWQPAAPGAPEQEYRILELGETIQEGDEFEFGNAWLLTHRIGDEAPADIAYRRKITPVAPPVEKEMICPKANSCSSKICSHAKPHDVSFACNMTNITCPVCAPGAPAVEKTNYHQVIEDIGKPPPQYKTYVYCPSCEKLRGENARLKDILDNLNIQAVRDVAKGWVSIPSVEWDAVNWDEILRPESDANQPKGEG